MVIVDGGGSPHCVEPVRHAAALCKQALGRRFFPTHSCELLVTDWAGMVIREQQFEHSACWALSQMSLEQQTVVWGAVVHIPSGVRFINSAQATMFHDRHTAACAVKRAMMAWLSLQDVCAQSVALHGSDGRPAVIRALQQGARNQDVIDRAWLDLGKWQSEALWRVARETSDRLGTTPVYPPIVARRRTMTGQ